MILNFILSLAAWAFVVEAAQSATDIASSYSLTTSTSFPFPTATQANSDTQNFLLSDWSLSKGHIQDGTADVAFVADPFPANSSSSNSSSSSDVVLQVTYPAGSFSHQTGGTQFYSLWNSSTTFQSMMISYEVAFDEGFNWVKGGKLPGLRGGQPDGCSGGNQPTGSDCFSTRLMWRQDGNAEVYAYIPTPNGLCNEKSIICNDDFGVSISRGSFTLLSGQWNRVTMLVRLNNPVDVANGNVQLFFNDVNVINQQDLQFRKSSNLSANGMYFSTFFGGSDDTWATPVTTHSYYRNIQLWAGDQPSNLSGQHVNMAFRSRTISVTSVILSFALSWTFSSFFA